MGSTGARDPRPADKSRGEITCGCNQGTFGRACRGYTIRGPSPRSRNLVLVLRLPESDLAALKRPTRGCLGLGRVVHCRECRPRGTIGPWLEGADAGANGRMDKYVDARARFTPMCAQQAALLAQASAYLAQLLAAVDAVHVALDDCVDTLLGPASDTEPDLLAAPATAAAMHAAGHISKTELDGVVAGECVADDYVLALDTECRTAGKLCSFLHRVLLSSAAQLAGVGPLVPHAGILLDTATLAGEPVLGLRTQAAASFTAL